MPHRSFRIPVIRASRSISIKAMTELRDRSAVACRCLSLSAQLTQINDLACDFVMLLRHGVGALENFCVNEEGYIVLVNSILRRLVLALILAGFALPAQSETLVGSNIDSRVLVGLKVNSGGVQAHMPEGWASIPFPGGPLKGSNLLFALIDGVLEMDPEGKSLDPASRRAAVLVGLGKKDDTVRMYVLRILTTVPERNPYGVATAAEIARTKSLSGPSNGARASSDEWRIASAEGGELVFSLDYTTG